MDSEKKKSFEESLTRLEEIVRHLENGDLPLDESIRLFEEGTGLVSDCTEILDKAEQKVAKLVKGPDGAPEETVFGNE